MVSRARRAVDPPTPHFEAHGLSSRLENGREDFLAAARLYRRRILDVQTPGGAPSGAKWFVGARGGFLTGFTNGVVTDTRTAEDAAADGIDGIIMTLALGGRYRVMADGRDETFEAGDLFIEDTRRPRTAVSEFSFGGTLFIPRERYAEATPTPSEQLTLTRLSRSPLAPAISQQIQFLVENLDTLASDDFEAALEAAIQMALFLLRKEGGRAAAPVDGLLAAAKAYIDEHFRDPDLSPTGMAKALACSRAVLYRSFATADLAVGGYLRDVRFRAFLEALRSRPDAQISVLALESGFVATPTDFTKLFKRAYGLTPKQARQRLLAEGPAVSNAAQAGA